MPRRFFRKFAIKRHELSERWFLSPFRHMLHDQRLWGIRRKTVVPAFGLGLFVGCLPLPGHFLASALAALLLRINIPVAVLATLLSNPLTMGPLYYFNYRVGAALLPGESPSFHFEPTLDWLTSTFLTLWQPLLLGSVLVGALAGIAGYVGLDLLWRNSIANYKAKKRSERHKR
jgi:uncharacterized protein (DUF2062 family)